MRVSLSHHVKANLGAGSGTTRQATIKACSPFDTSLAPSVPTHRPSGLPLFTCAFVSPGAAARLLTPRRQCDTYSTASSPLLVGVIDDCSYLCVRVYPLRPS